MKRLSQEKMVEIVKELRKKMELTQEQLSVETGINRQMIGRLENREYMPSISQLEKLAEVLGFDIPDLYVENEPMVYTAYRSSSMSEEEKEALRHNYEPQYDTQADEPVFCVGSCLRAPDPDEELPFR